MDRIEAWARVEEARYEGRLDRAVQLCREFLELEPKDARARAILAQCLSLTGEFEQGLEEAKHAVHLAPDLSETRGALLEALENNELFEEFKEEAEQQSKDYPDDFYPWEARARSALLENDGVEAKKCFLKAAEIKPDSYFAWIHLAPLYLAEADYEKAFDAFSKAHASVRDNPAPIPISKFGALTGMAISQLTMGNAEWALILAKQAEDLNVSVAEARRLQARCKLSLAAVDAIASVEDAIRLGGEDGYLEIALAYHKAQHGSRKEARRILERSEPGHDPYADNIRAITLAYLGHLHDSLAQLERLKGILPEYVRQNSMSIAYLYKDHLSEALSAIRQALQHKRDQATLTNAGILCIQNNDLEEAEDFFEEVLKIRSDNPSALLNLGRIYAKRDKPSRARTYLKRVANSDRYDPQLRSAATEELSRLEGGEEFETWMKQESLGVVSLNELEAAQQLLDHYASKHFERECCRLVQESNGPLNWSRAEPGTIIRLDQLEKEVDVYGVTGSNFEILCLGECKLRIRSSEQVSESEIGELIEKLDLATRIEGAGDAREVRGFFFSNVDYYADAKQRAFDHGIRLFVARPTNNWQTSASWRIVEITEVKE